MSESFTIDRLQTLSKEAKEDLETTVRRILKQKKEEYSDNFEEWKVYADEFPDVALPTPPPDGPGTEAWLIKCWEMIKEKASMPIPTTKPTVVSPQQQNRPVTPSRVREFSDDHDDFVKVTDAYAELCNPARKKAYDERTGGQDTGKFYETLGLAPSATAKEVKEAYRKKSLETHPDRKNMTPRRERGGPGSSADTRARSIPPTIPHFNL